MIEKKFLLIEGRNFGDAVIATGLIESIGRSLDGAKFTVFTRPHFEALYAHNPFVEAVYCANFPMGTDKRFDAGEARNLVRQIATLRRQRFDHVVSWNGDFRENLIGWAIDRSHFFSIFWEDGHPRRRLIRQGLGFLPKKLTVITPETVNIYTAIQQMAVDLGASVNARPQIYDVNQQALAHEAKDDVIGLHPSASVPCRHWPIENWRSLAQHLLNRKFKVKIFGAPNERDRLLSDFARVADSRLEIVTGSLQTFFAELSKVKALVGLDSFSVHVAYAIGVPRVMISGPNLAEAILPPETELIDGGKGLPCAPCMNVPTCENTDRPYRCMTDTTVEAVVARLNRLLGGAGAADPKNRGVQ